MYSRIIYKHNHIIIFYNQQINKIIICKNVLFEGDEDKPVS